MKLNFEFPLRIAQRNFRESKRKYDLSRAARMLKDEADVIVIRVVRPRFQLMNEEKQIKDAYGSNFPQLMT